MKPLNIKNLKSFFQKKLEHDERMKKIFEEEVSDDLEIIKELEELK